MSVRVVLIDTETNKPLHTEDYLLYGKNEKVLCITTPQKSHGVFKTTTFAAESTVILAQPKLGGTVEITDLILSFEKKASCIVTVSFYDGTETANVIQCFLNDGPVNIAVNFMGQWEGWRDAYVRAVESGADATGVVALGYLKHADPESPTYAVWNSRR